MNDFVVEVAAMDLETVIVHELVGKMTSEGSPFVAGIIVTAYQSKETGLWRIAASWNARDGVPLEVYELTANRLEFLAGELRKGPPAKKPEAT